MAANTGRYLGILTGIIIFLALNGFIDHDWVANMAEREIMTAHGIHPAERSAAPARVSETLLPSSDWTRDEAIGDTDSEGSTAVLTPVKGVLKQMMVTTGQKVVPGSELAVLENGNFEAVGRMARAQAAEARAEAMYWRSLANLPCSAAVEASAAQLPGIFEYFKVMESLSDARGERWTAEADLFEAAAEARVITSPVHGTVGRVYASAGQNLSKRDMIMELGPQGNDSAGEARK